MEPFLPRHGADCFGQRGPFAGYGGIPGHYEGDDFEAACCFFSLICYIIGPIWSIGFHINNYTPTT